MIGVAFLSDHTPLMLLLALPPHAPAAKCWCLNTRLLIYKDILAEIEDTIKHYLDANDTPEGGSTWMLLGTLVA
ncbi:hypothetical protein NDU88_003747 [Pleurodeles waltl]|uniref:Uncharacterized protein n=1 Tax=Pleurodeles waltl TaxID=8319 RepID=A0AAV7LJS2_PLEWA|nr:hypothetical protein NDU88_003747 [Pleurodeles waltl]